MIIFKHRMYKSLIMRIARFWRSACWLAIIFILTFLPGNEVNKIKMFHHADKLIHLFLFIVLSILLLYDMNKFHKVTGIGIYRIFVVITQVYVQVSLQKLYNTFIFLAEREVLLILCQILQAL